MNASRAPPNPTKGKHPARPSGVQSFRNHQHRTYPMSKIPLQAVPGSEAPGTISTTQPDAFDPANLRLSQSFTETVGVKKLLTTVPVRKPGPQDFVRVHPSRDYREDFRIIERKDEREEYIVTAALVPELSGEFVTKTDRKSVV